MKVRHEDMTLVKEVNKALEEKNLPWAFIPEPHIEFDEHIEVTLQAKNA